MNYKKVTLVQRRLSHYRIDLFNLLKRKLDDENISLTLLVGSPAHWETSKNDTVESNWAIKLKTKYFLSSCWMPFNSFLNSSDLIIIPQENKLIYNNFLFFRPRKFRIAFWGHGKNLKTNSMTNPFERYKLWLSRRVDWWFAYTKMSAEIIEKNRFKKNKITVLDNAVDTKTMKLHFQSITQNDVESLKKKFSITKGPVGIFIGSLYKEKRISFLLQSVIEIKKYFPDFHLFVLGDGPDRCLFETISSSSPWIHVVGSKYDRDKALFAKASDVLLNPGAVGLNILDAFVFELPLFTTDCGLHGPEISYMISGNNGVVTPNCLREYVNLVITTLSDKNKISSLQKGCSLSAQKYTLENMADNFSVGIQKAINTV